MHAPNDDVECPEHVLGLIESPVLVDVDLDATQNSKGCRSGRCFSGELIVDALDLFELSHQTLSRETVRDGQAGRVIGHDDVLMTQRTRSVRHLDDRTATVGPQRVRVTVSAQRFPERIAGNRKGRRLRFQLREVSGDLCPPVLPGSRSPSLHRFPSGSEARWVVARCSSSPGSSAAIVSAARRNAATRYVGACDRSRRNAIRFSASTGSIGSEPRAQCCARCPCVIRSAVAVTLLGVSRLAGARPAVHGFVPAALTLGWGGGRSGLGGLSRLGLGVRAAGATDAPPAAAASRRLGPLARLRAYLASRIALWASTLLIVGSRH